MNEDQLITAIRGIVEEAAPQNVPAPRPIVLGIGDDAAAWQPSRSHLSVITSDALVDGVHFLSERMRWCNIGYRAMAANLSDIAAMGARPVLATVALGVPPGAQETQLLDLYTGMLEIARRHGMRIVGGDIVRAGALTLAITIVGEVRRTHLRRRDVGRPGDIIAVTGPLGGSHAGLKLLRHHDLSVPLPLRERGLRAFERPEPRVSEGRRLAASSNVHAMMDCSDGLLTDLSRMARASGCGALIEHVPIDPAAQAVAAALGEDASAYARNGGEDFELIVTIAARAFRHLAGRFETHFGRHLIRVGVLEKNGGLRMREASGEIREVAAAGWDHLTSAAFC